MLDSITLTRVPGTSTILDSWTVALTAGVKTGNFTIQNVPTTQSLAQALSKLLVTMDSAINLAGGSLALDATKL